MSPARICTVLVLVLVSLGSFSSAAVFVNPSEAHLVLVRSRRANSGFLEELKQGNLERECVEEICDYEEAREVFEDETKTREFWKTYIRADPCAINPCQNHGTCQPTGTSYSCLCPEGFEGRHCQTVFEDSLKCLYQNGRCEHFCDGSGARRRCSCSDGYRLGEDDRSCMAQVEFPCGQLVSDPGLNQTLGTQTRLVGSNQCPRGECPWQVLVELNRTPHCGGVLIRPDWVLTAAHCVVNLPSQNLSVVAGVLDLESWMGSEQRVSVQSVVLAPEYSWVTGQRDLALVRLDQVLILSRDVVPVCLPNMDLTERELVQIRYHTVLGWGQRTSGGNKNYNSQSAPGGTHMRKMEVPIIQHSLCAQKSGLNLTDHMICAGYMSGRQDSCRGDDGSPLITEFGSTHFLLGVAGWGRGCAEPGFYGVYTNVAYFIDWIHKTLQDQGLNQDQGPTVAGLEQRHIRAKHNGGITVSGRGGHLGTWSGSVNSGTKPCAATPTQGNRKLWRRQGVRTQGKRGDEGEEKLKIMLWIYGLLLLLDLVWTHGPGPGLGLGPVFVSQQQAQQVLVRNRRANSFLEEMKKGNMERECVEERCDYEEAREIFEDVQKTDVFWAKYVDGDACESSPCLHQGVCKDTVGGFDCFCKTGFQGASCEIVIPELCENQNGGCDHFCEVERGSAKCSCADGYFLSADQQSCDSHDTFKCGVIISDKTRTVFRYDRNQSLNLNQTQTLDETWFNETQPDSYKTSTVHSPIHVLDSAENSSMVPSQSHQEQLPLDPSLNLGLGLDFGPENPDLNLDLVQEELITSQMASWTRIVNGEDCPPGECPWQALLLNEDHRGFCGGTILNAYIVLTAAHCMNQSRHIYVVLGEFDTQVKHGNEAMHQVEKVLLHQKYRPDTYHNDIALIKLRTPVTFSRYILPVCLPTRDFAEKVLMRQGDGLVSGFGRLGEFSRPSSILQRLAMPYVERARCMESTQFRISGRMFCAGYETGGKDACQGDSGGPHVTRFKDTYFITGIVSWGEGCARRGKYGVYTQVSKYIGWIREGIRALVPQKTGQNQDQLMRKRRRSVPPPQQVVGLDQDPERTKPSGPEPQRRVRGFQVLYL
ncbi:uncharacterized protein [Eucyclogobius newberryi]|uniref:uncharacterized protein n=1 Tax=Eucyclogobius newberryi TaxID=166745 RepID=UPI003B5C45FB